MGGQTVTPKYKSIQAFIDSADNNDPNTPIYYFAKTSEMFTTNSPPKALYMRPCYQKGDSDCNSIQLVWQGEGWEPGYILLKHTEALGGSVYTSTLLNYRFNHPNDIMNFTYNSRYYITYLDKYTNKDSYLYWIPSIKRIGNFQDRASNWQKGNSNSNWYGVIEMTEAASRKYAGTFI